MMTDEDRISLEDAIFDAHFSAQKYVEDQKDLYHKLLEVSVSDALDLLERFSLKLKDDPKTEAYKLHMFVPLHLLKLLEVRKNQNEKDSD